MTSGAVVAVETSGPLGSVAVAVEGEVLARRFLLRRSDHASRLVPAVDDVLQEGGVDPSELTAILVGTGPGSFTGVRVAAATANGLAAALGLDVHGISSLLGAAVSAEALPPTLELPDLEGVEIRWNLPASTLDDAARRCVLFDARGGRVYAVRVRTEGRDLTVEREPWAGTVSSVLNGSPPPGTWFAGDGALAHESVIRAAGFGVLPAPAGVPTADGLLRAAVLAPQAVRRARPGAWAPDYLRDSSAVGPPTP